MIASMRLWQPGSRAFPRIDGALLAMPAAWTTQSGSRPLNGSERENDAQGGGPHLFTRSVTLAGSFT
jgi:hypothetical protein